MTVTTNHLTQQSVRDRLSIDIEYLRGRLQGALLQPGDEGYEEARAIWNAMIDKRPAVIVLPENTQDVSLAVQFARDHDLQLSVRGCGHNIAGTALSDNGLTISFARMNKVTVDVANSRATVQPGANWADVDRATEPHGLVIPGGIVSTTGVAGFTLGGGFGWLTRKWGYTSDSLISATVVTADGQIRTSSAESEPDLYWGIRGGGGNFGVVTEFEFQAYPFGPEVAAGMVLWPMDQVSKIIDLYRRVTAEAPVELGYILFTRVAPPAPFLPEEIHGKPVVGIAACYGGDIANGLKLMEPVKSFGTPLVDTIKAKPFREHQASLDSGQPYGRRYYWKSVYLDAFTDSVQDALLQHATSFSSPYSSVLLPHLGGNAKSDDGPGAVSNRNAEYLVNYQASWEDPTQDDTHIAWARTNFDAMRPHASGQYVNFMTEDEVSDPGRPAYSAETQARLAQIKRAYDPGNMFNLNKNIVPAN
jgi:FAD/FMN-containing dehydrogenase